MSGKPELLTPLNACIE